MREANEKYGIKLGETFRENERMFWKEVKRVRKGERVKQVH